MPDNVRNAGSTHLERKEVISHMRKILALLAAAALMAFAAPAFAANPFMDVPMNHWAYDAIGQLAASGIVNGYPDGTYKGNQPMTRYEMATLVARGLAVVDMNKASKQDVEMLKKLVVEFKDELNALGVQVDRIDRRVTLLEENIGGWKIYGELRFDAKFGKNYQGTGGSTYVEGKNEFDLDRYRLFLKKQIDENTSFTTRIGRDENNTDRLAWELYYVETVLPWDVELTAGLFEFDWEDDAGLYDAYNDDAWIGDLTTKGFYAKKALGMADMILTVNRDDTEDGVDDSFIYGARFDFNLNETFRFALSGLATTYDNLDDSNWHVLYADFTVNVTPNIAFKGAYYTEKHDANTDARQATGEDAPDAWKAILDVKQEALGFTGLWVEYGKIGRGFEMNAHAYDYVGMSSLMDDTYGTRVLANRDYDETTILYVRASQKWNDTWGTFQRYFAADFARDGVDDTTNVTFGVEYRLSPAISFELTYDKVDWGQGGAMTDDDSLGRLRTLVTF
jgi:hypothetical protein